MSVAVVINHTPWRPERVAALRAMRAELPDAFVHDADFRQSTTGVPFVPSGRIMWIESQHAWSLEQTATHLLFCTDDLHLAPGFLRILDAMIEACPDKPIGLLSNHPDAHELASDGLRWYRCNAWMVGPAMVVPRLTFRAFAAWFASLTIEEKIALDCGDDSFLNEWITKHGGGGESLHPLPTPIEHRRDVESTYGGGDAYAFERVSWRRPWSWDLERMTCPKFWRDRGGPAYAPMLQLPKGP